jgi:integrase/recombinase XerD
MLTVYRRHGLNCKQTSRRYRRCNCPCWVEGTLEGQYVRQSLKVRSWERAEKKIREMEEAGDPKRPQRITIGSACAAFVEDAEARNLKKETIDKFRLLFKRLKEFANKEGIRFLSEFDLQMLRKFRATWTYQNYAARNQTGRLRALFRFAHDSGWIKTNPARNLKSEKVAEVPTLPFSRTEFQEIVKACDSYPGKNKVLLRAFVLLLRYSGLRIRDAVRLDREKVQDGKLFLYTSKTGIPVNIPLPSDCLDALAAIPENGPYYFWSGQGSPKGRVGNFQGMLATLFKLAGVQGGHAHRFRDTFAVELLLAGVSIENVSILLGHANTRITEKHYAPWIAARQERLEEAVKKTWTLSAEPPEETAKHPPRTRAIRTKTRTVSRAIKNSQ